MDSKTFTPYNDYKEYLQDLECAALLEDNAFNEAYSQINERVRLTNFFIPTEYIVNVFNLDEQSRRIVYLLAVRIFSQHYTSLITEEIELVSPVNKNIFHKYLIKKKTLNFTERIKRFILTPNAAICKPWLKFYIPNFIDMVAFEASYTAMKNLTLYYLNCESEKSRIIWLYGKIGSGRKTHIKLLCGELNIPLMFVDMKEIAHLDGISGIINEIILESLLTGCFICFENVDVFFDVVKGYTLENLFGEIKQAHGLCFATAFSKPVCPLAESLIIAPVEVMPPNYEERVRLWEYYSSGCTFDGEFDIKAIAERFLLSPAQIKSSMEEACNISISQGKDTISDVNVYECCRKYSMPALLGMGRLVSLPYTLGDLVLPQKQSVLMKYALDRALYRNKVYSDWGFGSKSNSNGGLCILFCGPPGTGKTMAASAFAGELKISLLKIDLPMVVSKYIGETEKNLKEIFDEAKAGNYILFFDEADSLFGKRTEIKDSKDKNANMEVSYLLQRLEEYEGITILATNMLKNFDEAFKRRFHFVIEFPLPDKECRKTIWENVFPQECPLLDDVDYDFLSAFKLTGSNIKNCALTAAFSAASENNPIGMEHIIQAIRMENEKNGLGLVIDDYKMCPQ